MVVGGGPAGLEAARVSAGRGHEVVLFEAGNRLGGQIALAAAGTTRRQIRGVADWLIAEVEHLGVELRLNHYAEADEVIAERPDVVIVATGGWPAAPDIPGAQRITSAWDVLAGACRPGGEVLLVDEVGDQPAAVTADVLARAGATVELVTPDRTVLQALGPTTSAVALRDLSAAGVRFSCLLEPVSVGDADGRHRVTLRHVLTGAREVRTVDHVVIENGTEPMDEVYHALKPAATNLGQLEPRALVEGAPPFAVHNPDGHYQLARIGDAVASRNIHAAVLDALRVCKDL